MFEQALWRAVCYETLERIHAYMMKQFIISVHLIVNVQSSILYCLLGELEPLSGEVAIVGSLGYAAQEPWLYTGSVRENILFGLEYEEEWYQKVVDACCLREDIEQLAVGDMTLVGERGVSLSGGQKARVTLARYTTCSPKSSANTLEMH